MIEMDSNRFARFPFSFLRLLRESVGRSAAPVDEARSSVVKGPIEFEWTRGLTLTDTAIGPQFSRLTAA